MPQSDYIELSDEEYYRRYRSGLRRKKRRLTWKAKGSLIALAIALLLGSKMAFDSAVRIYDAISERRVERSEEFNAEPSRIYKFDGRGLTEHTRKEVS